VSADAHGQPDTEGGVAVGLPSGSRQVSIEQRRRLVGESLRIGNPGNRARDLPTQADPRHECQIALRVTDIRPYEHNPRRTANAKFAEIKASIRAMGIRNPLTVTRRPGETHFIVESGGNTRLLAVQQLWAETAESRFEKLSVLFRPWRSESYVLSAHMVENEQRGDMTFWDRACGVIAIKDRLEAEQGHALSLRQLEAELTAMGLATNPTSLSHYVFVTQRLRLLAESIPELSAQDIKTIQPRMNALKRHAQARAGIAEAALYASIFDPAIQQAADRYRQGEGFSAAQLCDACEVAVARHLDQPVAELRLDIDAIRRPGRDGAREIPSEPVTPTEPTAVSRHEEGSGVRNSPAVNGVDSRSVRTEPPAQRLTENVLSNISGHGHAHPTIADLALALARQAAICEHLRFDPMAPLGYWVTKHPVTAQELPSKGLRVWWLLAHLARAESGPRAAQISGDTGGGTAPTSPCDRDSSAFDPIHADATGLLDWLLDPEDAGATLAFLDALRQWRISRGQRSPAYVPAMLPASMGDA